MDSKEMLPCVPVIEDNTPDCNKCMYYKIATKNTKVKEIIEYTKQQIDSTEDITKKLEIAIASNILLTAIAEKEQ